jgi:cyclophilin family peptidyl-prolyl cis-trans isomerase
MSRLFACWIVAALAVVPGWAEDVAVLWVKLPKEKKAERIVIETFDAEAPQTSENFRKLARKGFYKGTAFHRVFPGTLVQGGDPLSRSKERANVGTGGPGYTLQAEIRRKHAAGSVAAARVADRVNPGRRSNGSQFYIALKAMPDLDGQYTVFGRVIDGLDVVERISAVPADSNDNPIQRVVIRSCKLVPREKLGL